MSVNLLCPSCGSKIGEASHEDNYKEIFYHRDKDDKVICQSCGHGTLLSREFYTNLSGIIIVILFLLFAYLL